MLKRSHIVMRRSKVFAVALAAVTCTALIGTAAWATVVKPKPPSYYDGLAMVDAARLAPADWDYTHLVDDGGAAVYVWNNFQRAVDVCMARRGFPGYEPVPMPFAPLNAPAGDGKSTINPVREARFVPSSTATQAYFNSLSAAQKSTYASTLRGTAIYAGFSPNAEDGVSVWTTKPATSSAACEGFAQSLIVQPSIDAVTQVGYAAAQDMTPLVYSVTYDNLQDSWNTCMIQKSYQVNGFAGVGLKMDARVSSTKTSTQSMVPADQDAAWTSLNNDFNAMSAADSQCRTSSGVASYYQNNVMPAWNNVVQSHIVDAYSAVGAAGLAKATSNGDM